MFFSQGEHTHHGVECLLQLLLLHEQSTGRTLPLAVTASRGEETRQQHHQVPQRDLHRSAQPDGGGANRGPKVRGEVSEMRVTSRRNGGRGEAAPTGTSLQGESRQRCIQRQYQFTGIISWIWAVSPSVGVGNEFSQRQERKNVCVGWRESAAGGNEREK